MADPVDPSVEQRVSDSMGDSTAKPKDAQDSASPKIYKLVGDTKIPVSKFEGPLWQARRDAGLKAMEPNHEAWREAEAYYTNSQMNHRRDTGGDQSGTEAIGKNRNRRFSMTENIVYSTVNAVIPATFAKNPSCEVTMWDEALDSMGVIAEHLVNRLLSLRYAPGLNLKPKVNKCILRTEITNEAWIMVGYTQKEFSADQARADIQDIGSKLAEAKSQKEITELEGQLMALEETVDLLDPAGPFAKSIRGDQVIIDSNSSEDDFSDANYKMVWVMLPTPYLNAKFREKNEQGQYVSPYEGSHVADATATDGGGVAAMQAEIDSFKMLKEDATFANYGYKDQKTFDRAKMTKCWYVFDRVKRRFYLYADNDWKWPIWVYDDPYHLPNFYPLHRLQFHTDPLTARTKGEVSHYLDQQDAVNTINDEKNRARQSLRNKVIFDSNTVSLQDVTKWLNDGNVKALGIKMPEGVTDLAKLFMAQPLPALQYKELWDTAPLLDAANRISGVGAVLQGSQFKTNTTNGAIDAYNSTSNTRVDAKTDAIEDFIGAIAFDVLFLCMQFMDQNTVFRIIGQKAVQQIGGAWQQLQPDQIRDALMCTVEGGSTQKPTSAEKKKEALAVGQILGQFASVPTTTLILMKLFERAFDGIVMTDEDWQDLEQSVQMQQQSQMNPGAAPGAPQQGGPQQPAPQGNPQQGGAGNVTEQAIEAAVAKGVPRPIATKEVTARMQQHPQQH